MQVRAISKPAPRSGNCGGDGRTGADFNSLREVSFGKAVFIAVPVPIGTGQIGPPRRQMKHPRGQGEIGREIAEIIRHKLNGSGAGSVSDGVSDDGVADGFHSADFIFELPPLFQRAHGDGRRAEQGANHHHRNGDFNQRESPPLVLRRAAGTGGRGEIHKGHYSVFASVVPKLCLGTTGIGALRGNVIQCLRHDRSRVAI